MKKEIAKQDKKVDGPDNKRMIKILSMVVDCAFLALVFSIVALLMQGLSIIFMATLALSIITLIYAVKERRRVNAMDKEG